MPDALAKIDALVQFRAKHKLNFMIGIDGGINTTNIMQAVKHGANHIAAASAIFSNPDRIAALSNLEKCIK
jgi:ribulose-phosphate 3-epimerase